MKVLQEVKGKIHSVSTCSFQRIENGIWEHGILLNDGELGILDSKGEIPTDIWDYKLTNIPKDTLKKIVAYLFISIGLGEPRG